MSLKSGTRKNLLLLSICVSVLIAGVLIRMLAGSELLYTDLAAISGNRKAIDVVKSPEAAAQAFYEYIDAGDFEKAWEYSVEPDWSNGQVFIPLREEVLPQSIAAQGFTAKEVFVGRLNRDLGKGGYLIRLHNIEAGKKDVSSEPVIPAFVKTIADDIIPVKVTGNMLGACTVFRWEKEIPVLKIGDTYKVLLSGQKRKNEFFYQSWFSDITKIGSLRPVK